MLRRNFQKNKRASQRILNENINNTKKTPKQSYCFLLSPPINAVAKAFSDFLRCIFSFLSPVPSDSGSITGVIEAELPLRESGFEEEEAEAEDFEDEEEDKSFFSSFLLSAPA